MKITLEKLTEWNACKDDIKAFKAQSETDAVTLIELMIATSDIEKIKWANWLIVRVMDRKQRIRYAVFAAELALPIFEKKYPEDKRPRNAIEAAKKCLENDTEENREAAYYAAYSAAYYAANVAYAVANAVTVTAAMADAETLKKILEYGIKILKEDGK
jgi:hypothetical protein